jgi:hypothetical protein
MLLLQPALFATLAPACVRQAERRRASRVAAASGDKGEASDPLERARLNFSESEGTPPKNDLIYVGKGKWISGEAKAGRDPGGLTGGWVGGEVALKSQVAFSVGQRVRVRGTPAAWMANPLFARSPLALYGKCGEVSAVRLEGATVRVAVRLETGEAPPGATAEDADWTKLVVFNEGELEAEK